MKIKAKLSLLAILSFTTSAFALEEISLKFGNFDSVGLEIGLFSQDEGRRLAGVCFLGFGNCGTEVGYDGVDIDFAIDTVNQCKNEGYTITSCESPSYLSGAPCPYNSLYYAKCSEDKGKACTEAGYFLTCSDGYVADNSQTCPYDTIYTKCKCDPCSGYDYTEEQANAQGYVPDGSCLSCSETKYKRKNNPCVGYYECECGGQIGTSTCKSGTVTKYAVCKTCCENRCTLASCPENHDCDYEECSGKYCDKGCLSGYTDMCTVYSEYGSSTCTQMGYRLQSCSGDALLCPFDTTYKFCM